MMKMKMIGIEVYTVNGAKGTGELEDLLVEVPPDRDDCCAFNRGCKPQDTFKWTLNRPLAQFRHSIRFSYRDVIPNRPFRSP